MKVMNHDDKDVFFLVVTSETEFAFLWYSLFI